MNYTFPAINHLDFLLMLLGGSELKAKGSA